MDRRLLPIPPLLALALLAGCASSNDDASAPTASDRPAASDPVSVSHHRATFEDGRPFPGVDALSPAGVGDGTTVAQPTGRPHPAKGVDCYAVSASHHSCPAGTAHYLSCGSAADVLAPCVANAKSTAASRLDVCCR